MLAYDPKVICLFLCIMVICMMVNKVIVCPICGKRTFLRIQDGGYLNEYPIRVNCYNCHTLLKGVYIMDTRSPYRGLFMINADVEECDMDSETLTCRNADYVAEVSGELPCDFVKEYDGGLPESPFMRSTNCLDSAENHIRRLTYFTKNIEEWKKKKSTAFQLLDDGRIEYIATALNNKIGEYSYECDHYLKSLHCLQEVVLEETKDIFLNPDQDEYVRKIICKMSQVDDEMLHQFVELLGGVHGLILSYKKCVNVFSEFMGIYANLLPAETYMNFKTKEGANGCIATCSFVDLKSFYQDAYEALLSLMYPATAETSCFDVNVPWTLISSDVPFVYSISPFPKSFSAPLHSMIILESTPEAVVSAIRPGTFAFISPGRDFAEGLWVARIKCIPAALAFCPRRITHSVTFTFLYIIRSANSSSTTTIRGSVLNAAPFSSTGLSFCTLPL